MRVKIHIADSKTNETLVTFYSYGIMGGGFLGPVIEAGYIIVMVMVDDEEE